MADHVPAHDLGAEQAVLAACMSDRDAMSLVAAVLSPDMFYSEAHRRMYEACLRLSETGTPTDNVQVITWLRDHGRLEQVGGSPYVSQVILEAPAVVSVEATAEIVARKARVRRLQLICHRIVADGYAPIADEDAWIDQAERAVHQVSRSRRERDPDDTMVTVAQRVFTKLMEHNKRLAGGYTGTPTGFDALDECTGGLHDGESTIIAARPGMGKTALMMNIATNVARRGLGVVVFSLEMPNEQLATRTLCSDARVDVRKARTSKFDTQDWSKLSAAAKNIITCEHLHMVDRPSGLLEMRSLVRMRASDMSRAGVRIGLIAVDYVQLMMAREGIRSREEAVAENARGLKMLAKESNCPVIVLSQLNRVVETRNDKRPMLSDLRESGALEEAADCVIGMYRDDYYHEQSKTPGIVELALLKHRHGPTGVVEVGFEASSTTFYNLNDQGTHWAAQ